MSFKELTTAPATEPITLAEVKAHGRIDTSADDLYITELIIAVRQMFETETHRAFMNQSWTLWYDAPPIRCGITGQWWDGVREGARVETVINHLDLRPTQLSSITQVNSYGTDNVATVFASTNYFLDKVSNPARLVLNQGSTWPTSLRPANALSVEVVSGYGANPSDVPAEIRHILKAAVLNWYSSRGDCASQKQIDAANRFIKPMIQKYRDVRL